MPPCGVPVWVSSLFAEFGQDPGLQERLHQRQHTLVLDPLRTRPIRAGVRDSVKARLDVSVQHPPVTVGAELVDLGDRVVGPPLRPEPIRDRHEVGLEDRFQHQLQRRLDYPVGDGGDAQTCAASRTAALGIIPFPHRQRTKRTGLNAVPRSSRNPRTPTGSSTAATVSPSTPGVLAPVLPATRSHAIRSIAGSCTRLNRSSNRRPGSATAQR